MRRILISYQRSVGALREVIQLALGSEERDGRIFAVPGPELEPFRVWLDPAESTFDTGARDEWATSIRDAVATSSKRLHYIGNARRKAGNLDRPCTLRVVRMHAPERVPAEPRVIWGEGMAYEGAGTIPEEKLQASLDAANVLLERLNTPPQT